MAKMGKRQGGIFRTKGAKRLIEALVTWRGAWNSTRVGHPQRSP